MLSRFSRISVEDSKEFKYFSDMGSSKYKSILLNVCDEIYGDIFENNYVELISSVKILNITT